MHAAPYVGREARARAPGGLRGSPASDFILARRSRGERSLVSGPLNIFVLWSFILLPLLLAGSQGPGPVGGRPGDAIRLKNPRCSWAKIHRNREGFRT